MDLKEGMFIIALIWSIFCVYIGITIDRNIKKPAKKANWLKDLTGFNYKKKER
jgi:hypothetical protein